MIPLTSPIVMMVRAPFLDLATQWWEVALSIGILIGSFCFTIWLAGKIYRTGILMYGKKATYKELFKWLFYKA
ncbi:MAG: ABC-2 type transport system permease protein [Bacteroidia bacterium]|jgi:ABC-2 type transport system permease protein